MEQNVIGSSLIAPDPKAKAILHKITYEYIAKVILHGKTYGGIIQDAMYRLPIEFILFVYPNP